MPEGLCFWFILQRKWHVRIMQFFMSNHCFQRKEFQCIFVWSSKLNCLPHQLTSYFSHGFDTDPFCLLLCDVELPLWGFVDMKLYRKCLVLNKCHFQCVISDPSGLLTVVPLRLGGEICSGHITTILQYLNVYCKATVYVA